MRAAQQCVTEILLVGELFRHANKAQPYHVCPASCHMSVLLCTFLKYKCYRQFCDRPVIANLVDMHLKSQLGLDARSN